jgi:radical SAM superfamily enzyme YgiQ (UPF0313 family)
MIGFIMRRIALINPPAPFLMDERVFPNLGLVQLATSMRHKGEDASIIDLCGIQDAEERLRKIARDFDFFGFSSTSPQFRHTYALNRVLRQENPQAFTILGGAHASAMYSLITGLKKFSDDPNIKSLNAFDKIVAGEGDLDSQVIFSKEGPRIYATQTIKNLDSLPFPDRSLIDIHTYRYSIGGTNKPATTIMTQLNFATWRSSN